MHTNFRTYQLAVEFYREAKALQLPGFLKNQLLRAASSVSLNLSEGDARRTRAQRRHFFNIALASMRECQSVMQLEPIACSKLVTLGDKLAASLYCLHRALQ